MYDQRNQPDVRPGYTLVSSTTCPIASGDTGLWFDGSTAKLRNADGTDTVVTGSGRAVWASVKASTTAALAGSPTYDNGTSGVGATLTKATNGALPSQDGVSLSVGDRLLVKNQGTPAQNGIYVVTAAGGAGAQWVLTRATDADEAGDFTDGKIVAVQQGTANANTLWQFTTDSFATIGTDSVTFSSSLLAPNSVTGTALSAGAQRYLAFTGHNAAGACTATGTKAGDTVVGVINLTDGTTATSSFESTITVADQIQQSSGSDLSAKKFSLLVVAKS